MTFTTLSFLIFVAIVVFVYLLLPQKAKPYFLIAASLVFYGWWKLWAPLFIVAYALFIYAAARLMVKNKSKKFFVLVLFSGISVLLFFIFRYGIFGGLIDILAGGSTSIQILFPLGFSYYMFKSISYLIDINNGTVEAANRFDRFLLYVTYFPEVSMGPISRAVDFLPQIETEKRVNAVLVNKGLALIAWGFFKKIVFADMLASMISPYYTDLTLSGNGFVWFLAAAGFLLQLYLDFSAYTDISIGVSTMLGYNIKPNFKAPFFALSISEFWRRWHITLSSWLLDYVFTPLQFIMRKLKRFASVIPALITFTLIGVWHGGTSAYLVFGFLMGVLVAIDSLISKRRKKLKKTLPKPLFKTVSIIITILVNILVFVFMKAGLASDGFAIIGSIFKFSTWSMSTGLGFKFFIIFGLSIVVTVLSHLIERKQETFLEKFSEMKQPVLWLVYLAVIFVVILFGYYGPGYDPIEFIYIGF